MKKKVLILFDLASPPPPEQNYRDFDKATGWDQEIGVKRAIQHLGGEAILVGVFDDIVRLIKELQEFAPEVVFNMTESFRNKRELEPQIAGVLELLGIPYTGTRSLGLGICQDKSLSKKILVHHRIRTAQWVISKKNAPIRGLKSFKFPAFVKPVSTESSEGISKDSLVKNESDCFERVRYLHEKFECDVMIEEFIEGRELYVSVMGDKRLKVFPIRELTFSRFSEDEPKFATYKVKWDENYRKKWGIRNEFAKDLSDEIVRKASKMAKKAFEVLKLKGYARFDMRLTEQNELVILEANPNPSIADYDDFPQSAKKGGISYDDLIGKIIDLAY